MALWVRTITGTPADLTPHITGLQWSNTNPGGDERATFGLPKRWFAGAPEIGQGNIVRIGDGLTVLFQGRIEENDRAMGDVEQIGVTAYGLGVQLKDSTMRECYVHRNHGDWQPDSRTRKIQLIGLSYMPVDHSVVIDTASGLPAIQTGIEGAWASPNIPISEGCLDLGAGLTWASIYYDVTNTGSTGAWTLYLYGADDDAANGPSGISSNLAAAASASGTFTPATPKRVAFFEHYYNATPAGADGAKYPAFLRHLALYGNHGLTKRGSAPEGFYASDVVRDIVGRATGMTARAIDGTTFVIPHLVFLESTSHEDAVTETTKFHNIDWGTWGPDSALDTSTTGYFDWKERTYDPHWSARRAECDDVQINVEMATLFNEVAVHYTDPAGTALVETRTASVPLLSSAGITRRARLDAGTLTQAGAQQLGDTFLGLSGQQSPGRGSVTLSRPIRHKDRGLLAPHFMRANGSNIRLPDVLPSRDLFDLTSAPDRRSTFPIKRIDVDASDAATPKVTVDVDQTADLLSQLQARLEVAAEVAVGR